MLRSSDYKYTENHEIIKKELIFHQTIIKHGGVSIVENIRKNILTFRFQDSHLNSFLNTAEGIRPNNANIIFATRKSS